MTRPFAPCLGFLRELEGHAVARLRGHELPDHARSCGSCRDRLFAAALQARLLSRLVPVVPDEVRDAPFLDGVYDRVLTERAAEDGPVTEILTSSLRPIDAPEDLDWPSDTLGEPRARQAMTRAPRPGATSVLWARVRRDVEGQIAVRRTARRRFRLRAAIAAVGLVLGAWFVVNWGTSKPPDIVFEKLVDMPQVDFSPTAVLRRAQGD